MAELRKYGAATTMVFPLIDRGTLDFESTPVTFAAGDTKIIKDEGAAANTTNNPAHEGNGIYSLALTATEMQAARIVITVIDSATKAWEDQAIIIDTYGNASAQHAVDLDDGVRAGLTALPNAAAEAAGGLFTRGTGAGQINQDANGRIDSNVAAVSQDATAADNLELDYDGTGYNKSNSTVGTVTTLTGHTAQTGDSFARLGAPAGASVSADIAAIPTDPVTTLFSGTADSGTANTLVDAALTEADSNYWQGSLLVITSGNIAGQCRLITGFTPGTDTITVSHNFTQAVGTNTYEIHPFGRVDLHSVKASVINSLVSGAVDADVSAMQADVVTAAAVATDAIGAAELATDAVNEIRDAILADSTAFNGADIAAILTDTGTTLDTKLNDIQGATFSSATDSLEAIRDRGDAAWTTGAGTGLTALASGTAQGGTASTIQLAAGETFADDELNGNVVKITSGTGAGQSRVISDYTGSTDTATITPNWATNPDATSVYEVVEGSANLTAILLSAANAGAITETRLAELDAANLPSDVDAILVDTAEIGTAGAGLTAIPWNASWDAEVQSEVADALVAFFTSSAQLVDDIWDEVLTGATHNVVNSAGRRLREIEAAFVVDAGTAQAGAAGTITLAATASATNDIYRGDRIIIVDGTGAGEHGIVTTYNGTTKVATMSENWVITPDATSVYEVVPASVDVETWQHGIVNALVSGAVDADVSAMQAAVITAAAIATGAVDADALATDAVNEIRDAILADSTAFNGADIAAILTDTAQIGAAGAGLTAIPWNASWDAEVQSEVNDALVAIGLDHLVSVAVTGTDITDDSIIAKLVSASATADWDDFVNTTDSLQALRDVVALEATVAALNDLSAAQVNSEVLDVMNTDTITLPGQTAPPLAPTHRQAIAWLYKVFRNRKTQTATQWSLMADDESTVDAKATVSDDGTTAIKQEVVTGP